LLLSFTRLSATWLRWALALRWIHAPTGSPSLGLCQTPALPRNPHLTGSLPLGQHLTPALCPSGPPVPRLHVGQPDPHPNGIPAHWATGPSSRQDPCSADIPTPWDPYASGPAGPQIHVGQLEPCPLGSPTLSPCQIPVMQGSLPLRPSWAPALQACQITTLPGFLSGHHSRAPNLPKIHTQIGLDAKGETSEQLRWQIYWSRTGDFFSPSLRVWPFGLLFDHQSSLPFSFSSLLSSLLFFFLFLFFILLSWFC
jgi:hypothetical protein